MDEKKLTEYTTVLNDLPDEIKNNRVNMMSDFPPTCNTPGCHAGLVSIAAKELPELRECYNKICQLEYGYTEGFPKDYKDYSYTHWAGALALYLGFKFNKTEYTQYTYELLTRWARDNPYMWDNTDGEGMFCSGRAFGQDTDIFQHSVIIDHFTAMSDRLNKKLQQQM